MSALPHAYDLLGVVLAEVQAVRAELAELRQELARRPADSDETDETLLAAINLEVGDTSFSVASLFEHAAFPGAIDLRLALEQRFGPHLTPKRAGRWLGRMHRQGLIAGRFVVDQLNDGQHRGDIWSVRVTRI